MRRATAVAALLAAGLAAAPSIAHASGSDVVHVRGRTFRGTVVEIRSHVLVRLRLDDGTELTVPWSEVVAIDRSSSEPLPSTTAATSGLGPAAPELPRHWYGWQTLLVDAGSVALMPLAGAGFVTYAVGPAIVHASHGRGGPALASLLLRISMPLVLAVIGVEIANATTPSNQNGDFSPGPIVGAGYGLLVGVLGAMAIDDAVIAWEPGKPSTPATGSGASWSVAVVPRLTLTGDAEHGRAGWMGIVGSF